MPIRKSRFTAEQIAHPLGRRETGTPVPEPELLTPAQD